MISSKTPWFGQTSIRTCSVILTLWLLLACSAAVAFNFPSWISARETTGPVPADWIQQAHAVFSFLKWQGALSTEFTSDEISHMHDVRRLMTTLLGIEALLTIALVVIGFKLQMNQQMNQRKNQQINRRFLQSILMRTGLALVCIVALLAILPFDALFAMFHKVFFPQGNWMFAADSMLITLFPSTFFASLTLRIGVYAAISGLACIVVALKKSFKNRLSRSERLLIVLNMVKIV